MQRRGRSTRPKLQNAGEMHLEASGPRAADPTRNGSAGLPSIKYWEFLVQAPMSSKAFSEDSVSAQDHYENILENHPDMQSKPSEMWEMAQIAQNTRISPAEPIPFQSAEL